MAHMLLQRLLRTGLARLARGGVRDVHRRFEGDRGELVDVILALGARDIGEHGGVGGVLRLPVAMAVFFKTAAVPPGTWLSL